MSDGSKQEAAKTALWALAKGCFGVPERAELLWGSHTALGWIARLWAKTLAVSFLEEEKVPRDILFTQAGGERRLFTSCCWAFVKKKTG